MITVKLPDETRILMYDDATELPAVRYKEFQKLLLQDSGIGSSMDDVGNRFDAFFKHLSTNKYPEAKLEAENLYYTHFAILEGINYKHLAFACLIHSVNDIVNVDFSANRLSELIDQLSEKGLTQQLINDQVGDIKKNSNPN